MTERFPTPSPIVVDLKVPAGTVRVDASETAETQVDVEPLNEAARDRMSELVVSLDRDELRVEVPENRMRVGRSPEYAVTVRCPFDSRLRLRSASADLTTHGRLGSCEMKTASGDAHLGEVAGAVRVDSASGDVHLGSAGGSVQLRTASGDLEIGTAAGPVTGQSVSGDVTVRDAHAAVEVQTVSGDLRVDRVSAGPVNVNAVSGDVDVAVVPGRAVWLDLRSLSGEMSSELAGGDGPGDGDQLIEIRGKTVSGDVTVRRAAA